MKHRVGALLAPISYALLGLGAAGCFSPELGECLACDGPGSCPSGQMCVGNVCLEPGRSPSVCQAGGGAGSAEGPPHELGAMGDAGVGGLDAPRCQVSSALHLMAEPSIDVCTGTEILVRLSVEGGSPPYHWYLPEPVDGLMLAHDGASPSAELHGAFTEPGNRTVRVVVESGGEDCISTASTIDLVVNETQRIVAEPALPCIAQQDYRAPLAGAGGDPTKYKWTVTGLPAGLELVGDTIRSTGSGPGAFAAPVELTIGLETPQCGLVERQVSWPAGMQTTCFGIEPRELPAPCSGVPYSAQLSPTTPAEGLVWEARGEVPGLSFAPESAILSGTTQQGGTFVVRLTGGDGRVAERSYELPTRERCQLAYVADSNAGARLHLSDLFLNTDTPLPGDLPAGEEVADFRFAPNGEWIAFRAGPPERYRLYLQQMPSTGSAASAPVPVSFECPAQTPNECSVLDYAWSADSASLAVALSGTTDVQDYVSGVSLAALSEPWPLVAQEEVTLSALVYRGELRWVGPRQVVLSIQDPFSSEQLLTSATVREDRTGFDHVVGVLSVSGGQFGYLPERDGFLVLNGQNQDFLSAALGDGAVPDITLILAGADAALGPWLSPSGAYFAKATADAKLQIFDLADHLLKETAAGVCGSVISWASVGEGRERLACAGLSNGQPVSEDIQIVDYLAASNQLTVAPVPEGPARAPLGGTQRSLSASGDRLLFVSGSELRLVDLSAGQPRLLPDNFALDTPARFALVGNHLLAHHGNKLSLFGLNGFLERRDLAGVETGTVMAPAIACQDAFSTAPHQWCGAPSASGPFVSSADSRTILFEDVAGALWIADTEDRAPAHRVAADLRSCSAVSRPGWTTPCAKAYAFQP